MKIRLRCRIFGHDFRRDEHAGFMTFTYATEHCKHCGLTKKEIESYNYDM